MWIPDIATGLLLVLVQQSLDSCLQNMIGLSSLVSQYTWLLLHWIQYATLRNLPTWRRFDTCWCQDRRTSIPDRRIWMTVGGNTIVGRPERIDGKLDTCSQARGRHEIAPETALPVFRCSVPPIGLATTVLTCNDSSACINHAVGRTASLRA